LIALQPESNKLFRTQNMTKQNETKNKEKNERKIPVPECGYFLGTIYFYLTEGCNLKCRHCWINPPFESEKGAKNFPFVDFELFKDICRQGKELGMHSVKLTGGEPLIHPDIEKIIDYINEEKLGLTIETNGVELTPSIVEKFLANKRHFLSISLDGVDAETHEWVRGVPGCFEAALNGARLMVRSGYRPQLIMSVMGHNRHQMESMVRLAEKEGCGSVKFNLVTPTERGEKMYNDGQTLSMKELIETGEWVERKLIPNSKIRVVYSHPSAFQPLGRVFSGKMGRCGIFSILGVLGSGKYALCGIGESVPELVFGDAVKDKLADIWNNNQVLNDIRKGLPKDLKGICMDCLDRKSCLASCIAMNYYRYRDLFAPHWYCEEAHKAKLFPASRIKPGSSSEY
jgi:SynChlorMet cassette radical SAM/SPASM protein ScmF